DLQPQTGDAFRDVDQLIDRHQLIAAEIERLLDQAVHNELSALDAVVNEHEAAGLLPVPPDLDLVPARKLGLDHLAADGGRRLFAATIEGAVWAINVVEARNSRRQAEILAKVPAHALAEQFLPAIAVFGHGRVGVPFLEWNNIGGRLLVSGVHAGGRREKEPPSPVVARGQQQVSVDQYGEHAGSLVGLDESHAAHVGGEIVHPRGTFRDIVAGSTLPKITAAVVDVG